MKIGTYTLDDRLVAALEAQGHTVCRLESPEQAGELLVVLAPLAALDFLTHLPPPPRRPYVLALAEAAPPAEVLALLDDFALPPFSPDALAVRLHLAEGHLAARGVRAEGSMPSVVAERITDAFAALDRDGRFTYVNQRAEQLLHRPREALLGRRLEEVFPKAAGGVFSAQYAQALATGEPVAFSAYEGTLGTWFTVRGFPHHDGLLLYFSDVSAQREAVQALYESEARARAILDTTVDAIITIDERGLIESYNKAAERIFGFTAAEVMGENVSLLMPSPFREEHDEYIENYLRTGHRRIIGIGREVVGQRKDGTLFPMSLAVSEVMVGPRRLFTGLVRDITERRRLEQEVLAASEEERRRIGQDLHDGLGQMLTGIGLIARNLARRMAKEGLPHAEGVEEVAQLVREADEYARELARGLVPVELEANGLASGLRRLAQKGEHLFGITCTFEELGGGLVYNAQAATNLYRIAQEALSNAVRHGKASRVAITLAGGEDQVRLRVEDNGSGIPAVLPAQRGMGLRIMHYRAELIGASLEVRPGARGGTVVTCTLHPRHITPARSEATFIRSH